MKNKKFFAPSIKGYHWIQTLSSMGVWLTAYLSGCSLWATLLICLFLMILTWATHVRGAAMGMLLATKSDNLRRYIRDEDNN